MAALLDNAAAWLAERRDELAVTVLLARGADQVQIAAVVGSTVFRLDDGAGGVVRHVSRDYLVRAADVDFGAGAVEPARGDRIVQTIGGVERTFEVLGPGNDEPDWRYSDPSHVTVRLHTREVGP